MNLFMFHSKLYFHSYAFASVAAPLLLFFPLLLASVCFLLYVLDANREIVCMKTFYLLALVFRGRSGFSGAHFHWRMNFDDISLFPLNVEKLGS